MKIVINVKGLKGKTLHYNYIFGVNTQDGNGALFPDTKQKGVAGIRLPEPSRARDCDMTFKIAAFISNLIDAGHATFPE